MAINSDDIGMSIVRAVMIGGGMFLAGRGWIGLQREDIEPLVDQLMPILGAIFAGLGALWGVYISARSKRVPLRTAERFDVPTINPVTGATEPADKRVAKR